MKKTLILSIVLLISVFLSSVGLAGDHRGRRDGGHDRGHYYRNYNQDHHNRGYGRDYHRSRYRDDYWKVVGGIVALGIIRDLTDNCVNCIGSAQAPTYYVPPAVCYGYVDEGYWRYDRWGVPYWHSRIKKVKVPCY